MSSSNYEDAAIRVAQKVVSDIINDDSKYNDMSMEDVVLSACDLPETHTLFKNEGVDLNDDMVQMEVLCEFQKAMAEELARSGA